VTEFVWASHHPILPKVQRFFIHFQVDEINLFSLVRLGNLMKVLTSDAIQDPTRVEARVRREVAMRKHTHEKMNAERKLTDEQRREKIESKKLDEEKKGIVGAVFKYACPIPLAHLSVVNIFYQLQSQKPF
jgi:hypothetical protein